MTLRGSVLAAILLGTGLLPGQTFDAGSNPNLSGDYFVRLVAFSDISATGTVRRARSLYGVITFDGAGVYTVNGRLADNATFPLSVTPFSASGTYRVAAGGMAQIQNPLDSTQTIRAGVGDLAVVGSSTESDLHDFFVAIPAGTGDSPSSLTGTWRGGYFDFPGGSSAQARTAFFSMTADGQGALTGVRLDGGTVDSGPVSDSLAGASYWLSQNGTGGIRFPASTPTAHPLIGGDKVMYLSADRNVMIGGAGNDFDLIVAVRAGSGMGNSVYHGTYYTAGMSLDPTQRLQRISHFFFYTGSMDADGAFTTKWHDRINPSGASSYDLTLAGGFALDVDGTMADPSQRLAVGAGGAEFVETGDSGIYHFVFGVRVQTPAAQGVWLNPLGVLNAASYAPATNPIAPGETVVLSGSGLADAPAAASGAPLPFSLGGVELTVNGRSAPLMYVSPERIWAVVPFSTNEKFATFQVFRNGTPSNAVTLYTNAVAPAAFSLQPGGTGPGAVVHADFTPVSPGNPARRGETLSLFANGLGAVTQPLADGDPAPLQPLVHLASEKNITVLVDDQPAPIAFVGLAPGLAGVCRIDFRVPDSARTGDVYIDLIHNPLAHTFLVTLRVGD